MKHKVFIDGSVGTTGLRIHERLGTRADIEMITIDEQDRKDVLKRAEKINSADVAFLCLPDNAVLEVMQYVNGSVKIIDTSTAHRTNESWVYGMPELHAGKQYNNIEKANRIAVPGCHATGFISLVAPIMESQMADKDYPFTVHSITGYSGGGKQMISDYEQNPNSDLFISPKQYALGQTHKHLPEMKKICGLNYHPVFNPILSSFYSGMVVTVPLVTRLLKDPKTTPEQVAKMYQAYYKNQPMVLVHGAQEMPENGGLSANALSGKDALEIFVFGTQEHIVVASRFDNLGKGASGTAIQCMNIMLGLGQTTGLVTL